MLGMTLNRCSYCGCGFDDQRKRSREHPLSEVLGSSWYRWATCAECNRELGRLVDQPFAGKLWIHEKRHLFRVPDGRGRIPGPPELAGELDDGAPVRAILSREGWYLKLSPTDEDLGDGQLRISVDADEDDPTVLLEKKRKRLEQRLGKNIEDFSIDTKSIENPHATIKSVEDTFLWKQLGAKIALSVGHDLLGDAWLDTPHARWLQDELWRRPTAPPPGFAPLVATSAVLAQGTVRDLVDPPEHIIMVMNSEHGAGVSIILFGEERYMVPLGVPVSDQIVWWIDPIARRYQRLPYQQFVVELIMRREALVA